jgi:hypothetical protein
MTGASDAIRMMDMMERAKGVKLVKWVKGKWGNRD